MPSFMELSAGHMTPESNSLMPDRPLQRSTWNQTGRVVQLSTGAPSSSNDTSFVLDGPTVPFFMYEPELLSSWAECNRSVHRWPFGPLVHVCVDKDCLSLLASFEPVARRIFGTAHH